MNFRFGYIKWHSKHNIICLLHSCRSIRLVEQCQKVWEEHKQRPNRSLSTSFSIFIVCSWFFSLYSFQKWECIERQLSVEFMYFTASKELSNSEDARFLKMPFRREKVWPTRGNSCSNTTITFSLQPCNTILRSTQIKMNQLRAEQLFPINNDWIVRKWCHLCWKLLLKRCDIYGVNHKL